MLFLIQNSGTMTEIPKEFQGKGFDKFLERCKFANMTEIEQREYISHMKAEWDREGQLDYAESRGMARGIAKGVKKTAIAMKADGVSMENISKYTGLTVEQIEAL